MDEKERPLKGEVVYGVVWALVDGVRGEDFLESEGRLRTGVVGAVASCENMFWQGRRDGRKKKERKTLWLELRLFKVRDAFVT